MPEIRCGSATVHWDVRGEGSPLLLIMGASFSARMWGEVPDRLATAHRVITFDNRGTGSSTGRSASIEEMAQDAIAVLDAAGIDQAHVFGVSLGGVVAQEVGLAFPDRTRSLILGCTGVISADKPRAPRRSDLRFRLPNRMLAKAAARGLYGPGTPAEAVTADLALFRQERNSRRGLVAQQEALRAHRRDRAQLWDLDLPVLVQHGTADVIVPLGGGRELCALIPGATLLTYEGAGHSYFVGSAQPCDDVLAFLAACDDTPAPALLGRSRP